jgi:hypothetical protein
MARCPAHDDGEASLSVRASPSGRALLHCFAGCKVEAIVAAMGLAMRDLFPETKAPPSLGASDPARKPPVTLEHLALAKKIPVEYLQSLGLHELPLGGVGIPYRDRLGNPTAVKIRTALKARDGSFWPKGKRLLPYGLERLADAQREGKLILVEGESDCWTLWYSGFPALGIPGASAAASLEEEHIQDIALVYLVMEPDRGGKNFVRGVARRLRELDYSGEQAIVRLDGAKDPSELHVRLDGDVEKFRMAFQKAIEEAVPTSNGEGGSAAQPAAEMAGTPVQPFEILDAAPESIARPMSLVEGNGYAATWVYGRPGGRTLVIVRDDGAVFSNESIPGAEPIRQLGLTVRLPEVIEDSKAWSGAGLKRFLSGERPRPLEVFGRVVETVNHFMDFDRSLGAQSTMCELVACQIFCTYFLDAFPVIGYLWSNGEKGSGKSRLLEVITELAYLGQMILGSSTVPTLRDLADYGATLAFDDAEGLADPRKTDPDKRALFLAGNRKGSTIAVKEQVDRGWRTRHVRTFCPRLFSAIRLPDDVLASRTIMVPLVKSGDKEKTDRNPVDWSTWPHERRRLVDDLWATGLVHLGRLREFDGRAAARSSLSGRNLEPWRAIFAVALWLETDQAATGLFSRLEKLSLNYQDERGILEKADITRLAIIALREMAKSRGAAPWEFSTSELTEEINELAKEQDLVADETDGENGKTYTSSVRVGRLLERLRLERPQSRNAQKRTWLISRAEVDKLCRTYGMMSPPTEYSPPKASDLPDSSRPSRS